MITAKSEDADVVLGLELGADDYVTKPFSPKQLMARIKAVLRRFREEPRERLLKAGELELDTAKHLVSYQGQKVDLTAKEFSILKLFMESRGRVLSRELILDKIWGNEESLAIELRAVDKHVGELRKKIKSEASRIVTVKNFGYRFKSDLE